MSDARRREMLRAFDELAAESREGLLLALARIGARLAFPPREAMGAPVADQASRLRRMMRDDPVAHFAGCVRCQMVFFQWVDPVGEAAEWNEGIRRRVRGAPLLHSLVSELEAMDAHQREVFRLRAAGLAAVTLPSSHSARVNPG